MKKMNNKGFSLVELIIVIAIMAILIGVLAPQYLKYVEKSRISADKDVLDSVYNACTTAASEPELTDVPGYNTNFNLDATSDTDTGHWTGVVLNTLGTTNGSSVSAKLKSKSCKGQHIYVSEDSYGNFIVTCSDIVIPEN